MLWISIAKRQPDYKQSILGFSHNPDDITQNTIKSKIVHGMYLGSHNMTEYGNMNINFTFTHWMPEPPRPGFYSFLE